MMVNRLVYIANVRLPAEKAHRSQICKLCEAFARNGAEVLLLHPCRRQLDPALCGQNVSESYHVPAVLKVKVLANLDAVCIEPFLPRNVFASLSFAHALL
jgi:hypothetical protein